MIALINPNIVMQKDDLFGTGIPYLPVELSYVAASLRQHQVPFKLIDSFGMKPMQVTRQGSLFVQGLRDGEILAELPSDTKYVVVYCGLVVTFKRITDIISAVKQKFPEWLDNLPEYVGWFNHKRYHAGVKAFPAQLYNC